MYNNEDLVLTQLQLQLMLSNQIKYFPKTFGFLVAINMSFI